MRLTSVLSETGRNLRTGMTHTGVWGLTLTLLLGILVQLEVSTVGSLIQHTRDYVAQGGSTFMLLATDNVSRDRCDALATTGTFTRSGALRAVGEVKLPALPDLPIQVFQASDGWWRGFGPGHGHVALAEPLATSIAPQLLAGQPVQLGDVSADSYYPWPDDGRVGSVSLAIVTRGMHGAADECWAQATNPAAEPPTLLRWPLNGESENTSTTKLNARLGPLTAYDDYLQRPSRFAWAAAAVLAGALTALAWRRRAIELALSRSLGVPRSATLLGAVLETLVWSGAAGLAALSWGVIQAGANPALIQMAAPIAASGTAGALATTLLVVPLLMRRDVDHYQRHAGT